MAAGHLAGDDDHVFGQAADAELEADATGVACTERHALDSDGEAVRSSR